MPVVVPEENPGQSATGHCLPGCARGGFLGGMPRDLARREPGYANEAVHRASNGLGGARLWEGGWENTTLYMRL